MSLKRTQRGFDLSELVAVMLVLGLIGAIYFGSATARGSRAQQVALPTLEEKRAAVDARIAQLEAELATLRAQKAVYDLPSLLEESQGQPEPENPDGEKE